MTTGIEYVYLSVVHHSGYESHDTSVAGECQNGEPPSDQELPRKLINKKNSTEKITKTCNPHPTPSDGGGGLGAKISK